MFGFNLISEVMAQTATPATSAGGFDPKSLLPFVLIVIIFYFFILRPQQKRMKQQREMLSALRRGDKVVTSGGIVGTIHRIENEREIHVEVAPQVVIKMHRSGIAEVVSATEKASGEPDAKAKIAKSTAVVAPSGKGKKPVLVKNTASKVQKGQQKK